MPAARNPERHGHAEGAAFGRERTLHLSLLAEVYLLDGVRHAAEEILATGRQLAERSGERFNLPQLLRLQAELATNPRRFDSLSRDALSLARAQQSALVLPLTFRTALRTT